jgi:molybdopterin-guanine dinucleotide biosynthesis protein A
VYHQQMDDVTAFILAGGKSTRMGTDKALLAWRRRTLLEASLDLVRALTREVLIVGDRDKLSSYGPVVEDMFRERGPLAGIHAALRASATELNLVLAVDLPFVELKFLKYLLSQARATNALVTLPRTGDGWQPLCAVYRRAFADLAEQSLRQGKNKIDALFLPSATRVIEDSELARLGFSQEMFRNLNTPKDLEAASRQHL